MRLPDATTFPRCGCDVAEVVGDEISIELTLGEISYRSPDGGFCVADARASADERLVLVGDLGFARPGDRLGVLGRFEEHPVYGRRLRIGQVCPLGTQALQRFLVAMLPGVGTKAARALTDAFGERVFGELDDDPAGALGVAGLGAKRAQRAAEAWAARRAERDLFLALSDARLGHLAPAVWRAYGPEGLTVVHAEPYRLVCDGLASFTVAESLAARCAESPAHSARVDAAICQALDDAGAKGHTTMSVAELLDAASALAGPVDLLRLSLLASAGSVVVAGEWVWRASAYDAEIELARTLLALADATPRPALTVSTTPPQGLSAAQWEPIAALEHHTLVTLTGGPGVGKTRVALRAARLASEQGLTVALCAPTGRAARRLTAAGATEAHTIHRLLGIGASEPARAPSSTPERLDIDLVVVDECSMLDQQLAGDLVGALPAGARLLLVGDPNQLSPVGPGTPFADLLRAGVGAHFELSEVHRAAARSSMVQAAYRAIAGEALDVEPGSGRRQDFHRLVSDDPRDLAALACELAARRLACHYDLDPTSELLVLCPSRRGPCGSDALNQMLQNALNPGGQPIPNSPLRVGDRVMFGVNDRALGLYNGSLARLEGVGADGELWCRDEDDQPVVIPAARRSALELAYATTIHKAQGAEARVALVVVHEAGTHPNLLSRAMLYMALMRGRQACVLACSQAALQAALATPAPVRHTSLAATLARLGEKPSRPTLSALAAGA